jgi:hypothetical protein
MTRPPWNQQKGTNKMDKAMIGDILPVIAGVAFCAWFVVAYIREEANRARNDGPEAVDGGGANDTRADGSERPVQGSGHS